MSPRMDRKISRRQVLQLAAVATAGLTLSACGAAPEPAGGGTAPEAEATVQPANQATAAPVEAATAAPATSPTGKLVWWFQDGGEPLAAHARDVILPAYMKENPGVEVVLEHGTWDNFNERFLSAFAAGTMADIFQPPTESIPEMSRLQQAITLDELVQAAKVVKLDDYPKPAVDTFVFGGKLYGIPFRNDVRSWNYHKSHLEEKGLKPPSNWDEVIALVGALTVREGDKLVRAGVPPWPSQIFLGQMFAEAIWQAGGDILTPDGKKAAFASPEGAAALTCLIDYHRQAYPSPEAGIEESPVPHFATGRVSMSWGGVWHRAEVEQYAKDQLPDLGVVSPPIKGRGDKGTSIALQFPSCWSISTQAKDPNLAFGFIDFLTRPDIATEFMKLNGSVPVSKALSQDPFFKNDESYAKLMQIADSARTMPTWPKVIDLYNRLGDQLTAVWFGRTETDEALATAAQQWDEVLTKEA